MTTGRISNCTLPHLQCYDVSMYGHCSQQPVEGGGEEAVYKCGNQSAAEEGWGWCWVPPIPPLLHVNIHVYSNNSVYHATMH